MRAYRKITPEKGLDFVDVKEPRINGKNNVKIQVIYAGICGTDHHIYAYDDWSKKRLKLPLTAGHEFVGKVIETGLDCHYIQVGDIVTAETHIICNECELCQNGDGHICEKTQIIGVDVDGAFAEYITLPEQNLYKISTRSLKHLSVLEPLGNAVHTMNHFNVSGKTVAIVGCGPIGLFAINVAKVWGAKSIIAIETNEYRMEIARKLGADMVINPLVDPIVDNIMNYTHGVGVDIIGEFSGNKLAIETAFKYIRKGGSMSLLGIPSDSINIDIANDVVFKSITIHGVVGRRLPQTWNQVQKLVENDQIQFDDIITHEFDWTELNKGMELMEKGLCGKVILKVGDLE
jgi:threonine 3-dehydrogenase